MLDPSVDDPTLHLVFLPSTGKFDTLSTRGTKTIEIFGLNDEAAPRGLPRGRLEVLNLLVEGLIRYDDYRRAASPRAETIRNTLSRHSFSSVFAWLVEVPNLPNGPRILGIALGAPELGPVLCEIITHYDVATWLAS